MDDYTFYEPTNLLLTQESISHYKPGGFHPVSLGDTFCDDRYEGGFSTVWLARDKLNDIWVSLKINSASEYSRELENLKVLSDAESGVYGIVKLLHHFVHQGPNGEHQCLVFELLGPTVGFVVNDYRESKEQLERDPVLRLVANLLGAMSSIHAAGYVHGDISGSNMAFTSAEMAHMSTKDILETLGEPEWEPLVRKDGQPLAPGLPKQLVKRAEWETWVDEDEEEARLIDFGETFPQDDKPDKLAQPSNLRAPERIFVGKDEFDHTVDLWCAGCTIYHILFGYQPFWYFKSDREFARQMFDFVEELPVEWHPKLQPLEEKTGEP